MTRKSFLLSVLGLFSVKAADIPKIKPKYGLISVNYVPYGKLSDWTVFDTATNKPYVIPIYNNILVSFLTFADDKLGVVGGHSIDKNKDIISWKEHLDIYIENNGGSAGKLDNIVHSGLFDNRNKLRRPPETSYKAF